MDISNKARQHVRELLEKHSTIDKEIKIIRESIMDPYRETDENIGGGKSSIPMFEVEAKAVKLVSNERLAFLSKFLAVTERVLSKCSDDAQEIIHLKYSKNSSWVKISNEVGLSIDRCKKIDRKVVDSIAEMIGF